MTNNCNKSYVSGRSVVAWLMLGFLSAMVFPVYAFDDASMYNANRNVWADGDEEGVYLVLDKQQKTNSGFQIYYRQKTDNWFLPGNWYPGRPRVVIAASERIYVFLSGGGCQSYDLQTNRTEKSLPGNLEIVAGDYENGRFYIVVRVVQSVELPIMPDLQSAGVVESADSPDPCVPNNSGTSGESNATAAAETFHAYKPGQYLLLCRDVVEDWKVVSRQPIPVTLRADYIDLAVLNDNAFIAWSFGNQMKYVEWKDGQFSEASSVDVKGFSYLNALTVNREFLLIVGAGVMDSSGPEIDNAFTDLTLSYRIGRRLQEGWTFGDSLVSTDGVSFTRSPAAVDFSPFGQNIAVFEWLSKDEVRISQYDLNGTMLSDAARPIAAIQQNMVQYVDWIMGPKITTALILVLAIMIFWRRDETMLEITLPDYVKLAPLWRRAAAFIVDIFMISILFEILQRALNFLFFREMPLSNKIVEPFFEQYQRGVLSPDIAKAFIVYFILFYILYLIYFFFCELIFRKTIGKQVWGLMVVDIGGNDLSRRQLLIRNLLRILEHYPNHMLFLMSGMIVMISNFQQRCGDVYARTLVVMTSPELKKSSGTWEPASPVKSESHAEE